MATASASPVPDIDFQAIAKRYFQLRQDERDSSQGNITSGSGSSMTTPDFENIALTVYDEEWVDRSNILGASAFAESTTTLNAKGYVNTTIDASSLSRVKITRGLCTDIGQTLSLPLPDDPSFLQEEIGEDDLEIDPSRPIDEVKESTKVKASRNLSGRTKVKRNKLHYEGRFSCLVYPSGQIMLQRDGPRISGTNPDFKNVIRKLKDSDDEEDQALVKNFALVELEKRGRMINVYCFRFEGYYQFQKVPDISYKAPNGDDDDDSDY